MDGDGVIVGRGWTGRAARVLVSPFMFGFAMFCNVDLLLCGSRREPLLLRLMCGGQKPTRGA